MRATAIVLSPSTHTSVSFSTSKDRHLLPPDVGLISNTFFSATARSFRFERRVKIVAIDPSYPNRKLELYGTLFTLITFITIYRYSSNTPPLDLDILNDLNSILRIERDFERIRSSNSRQKALTSVDFAR